MYGLSSLPFKFRDFWLKLNEYKKKLNFFEENFLFLIL